VLAGAIEMKSPVTFHTSLLLAAASAAAAGCSSPVQPELAEVSQEIGGVEGTLEYAIDAPWRMEPDPQGRYGAIPIQLTIHDTDIIGNDTGDWPDSHRDDLVPSQFCDLTVREYTPNGRSERVYGIRDLEEIERSYRWLSPSSTAAPGHGVCRPSTENCDATRNIDGLAEWHASAWYTPLVQAAGQDVILEMEARFSNRTGSCQPDRWNTPPHFSFKNYARVHLGEAALPRFDGTDNEWIYGDLHYHGQGTDNEGESAYNYRGVVRAMGALGLDFAFATEHASNAHQIMDADLLSDWSISSLNKNGLRDMSGARFGFLLDQLTKAGGVNRDAALRAAGTSKPQTFLSHAVYPQLFLGGELDAIPELPPGDNMLVSYGNGLVFDASSLSPASNQVRTPTGLLVRDIQGDSHGFGREHLVYLPRSSSDTGAFIPSNTSEFGGATRRLAEAYDGEAALLPDIEAHGYAFLAHHLNTSTGGRGPGGPPWSEFMLEKAWRSPAILGLQFWNEPVHMTSSISACANQADTVTPCEDGYQSYDGIAGINGDSPRRGLRGGDFMLRPWWGTGGQGYKPSNRWTEAVTSTDEILHHGAASWDRLLLKGLDPRETAALSWLPAGEPRRFFMAGGSDAHGELNYRREGYMRGTDSVKDVAIAKARNLVFAGEPELASNSNTRLPEGGVRHSQEQVVAALADGKFLVTDGPVLRIAIDRNGSRTIDDGDAMMGDVHWMHGDTELPLLLEWKSTAEFGAIETIDLYVGVGSADGTGEMRVFAPPMHGPRTPDPADLPGDANSGPSRIVNGVRIQKMADGYFRYDTLRTVAGGSGENGLGGAKAIVLDLTKFPTSAGKAPDRLFVRAFARTGQRAPSACFNGDQTAWTTGQCIRHYAFTNPIWSVNRKANGLLFQDATGQLRHWFHEHGTRLDGDAVESPVSADWQVKGAGDFDGDGRSDILWRNVDGQVAVWFMAGNQRIGEGYPGGRDNTWQIQGVGDFDRDGRSDILWRHRDGAIAIWYEGNNQRVSYLDAVDLSWLIRGVGDFNGDGHADILWRNTDGTIAVWYLQNGNRSGEAYPGNPGTWWDIQGVGDFEGDGKSDILWRQTDGALAIWSGGDATRSGYPSYYNGGGRVDASWQIRGVGDINGDGKSDIVWRHTDGNTGVWLLDGAHYLGDVYRMFPVTSVLRTVTGPTRTR
jgi:hypothetical protein